MQQLYQLLMFYVIFSVFSTDARDSFSSIHAKIAPKVINNSTKCPSDNSYHTQLRNSVYSALTNTLRDIFSDLPNCGPGIWKRVFHLNTSRCNELCPDNWTLATTPIRSCAGSQSSCRSALSKDINQSYAKVCGRVFGYAVSTPDAFFRHPPSLSNNIEGNFIDGVSITHGAPGSRTHIWSFGAGGEITVIPGTNSRCPCDSNDHFQAPFPPTEVGQNYFCDTKLDRLWRGECSISDSQCCSHHNPPYFKTQLSASTTDNIELRICQDQDQQDERILVHFAEVFVQ